MLRPTGPPPSTTARAAPWARGHDWATRANRSESTERRAGCAASPVMGKYPHLELLENGKPEENHEATDPARRLRPHVWGVGGPCWRPQLRQDRRDVRPAGKSASPRNRGRAGGESRPVVLG